MLKKLNLILQLFILKKVLNLHCGEKVILVGTGAEKKNCFWITITNEENGFLGIEKFEDGLFVCKKYENENFLGYTNLKIDELVDNKLEFVHYFKNQEIKLVGFYKFLLLFIPYKIIAFLNHYFDISQQFLFNTRSLSSRKRYAFLAFLIENFSVTNQGFSHIDVLQKLYGYRVFRRPDYDEIARLVLFNLDGLLETKELKKDYQHNYRLTGFASKTLEEYEEEDRKHRSMNFAQWVLIIVTLGLLIGTLIQANVIKIPTLLDFSQ